MDDTRRLPIPDGGYLLEDLAVGMSATFARTVTEADIILFSGVSGDANPVHMNQKYAEKTRFGGRIIHGMLTASFLSTVIGSRLPGPGSIYLKQNLNFRAPVRIGDTIEAHVIITDIIREKARVALKTVIQVGETVVVDGDALVLVPQRV